MINQIKYDKGALIYTIIPLRIVTDWVKIIRQKKLTILLTLIDFKISWIFP